MSKNKQYFIRVNRKSVPVSEEIFMAYHRSKRRDRYFEQDIKRELLKRDRQGNMTGFAPSKEDSLERLYSLGEDFADDGISIEDTAIQNLMTDKLHTALKLLSEKERVLIDALFFSNGGDGMSERKYAKSLNLSKTAVHNRKKKVLLKLKKMLESEKLL